MLDPFYPQHRQCEPMTANKETPPPGPFAVGTPGSATNIRGLVHASITSLVIALCGEKRVDAKPLSMSRCGVPAFLGTTYQTFGSILGMGRK